MALSLLVSTGANIKHENRMETAQEQFSQGVADVFQQNDADADVQAATISYSADTYDWTTRHIGLATIVLLLLIPIKQLSGYSYWHTFLRIVLALLLFIVAVIVILMAVSIAIGIFSHLFLN